MHVFMNVYDYNQYFLKMIKLQDGNYNQCVFTAWHWHHHKLYLPYTLNIHNTNCQLFNVDSVVAFPVCGIKLLSTTTKKGSLIWLCRTYGAWSLTLHTHSNHLRIVCVAKWETHKRVGYRGAVNASQWKPFPSMRIHQQRNFVVSYSLDSGLVFMKNEHEFIW